MVLLIIKLIIVVIISGVVKSKKGMVFLSHGLGSLMNVYEKLDVKLVQDSFSVLKYNNFDKWVKYTPNLCVDQSEDLIGHVNEEEKEDVVGFVGHSNGGGVGISTNFRWGSNESNRRVILKLALTLDTPGIYAKKTFHSKCRL